MAGHIFISYSKRDSGFALKLADSLTEAGRKVWIDRQIEAGERWRSSISQALRECSEAIVILSPRSVASEWVMHEGSVASGLEKPIYPVLMEPVNKLPIWMEELQFIDFHNKSYEDAFDQLIKALTPPNPLQDVLDQQVKAHQQTGELIGEALLRVIDEHYSSLTVSADAAELIARSKKAVAYRRRLVRGSAALAGILSIVALLAGLAAIRSGADIARAQFQLNTAQAEMALAQTGLDRAEAEAATAQAQQASAQEGYEIALTQQAVVQDALATATVAVGAAEQQLGDTQARLESAETQLARLFQTTGTIPVSDQPRDLAYAGASLWVANADKTLAKIDTATGIATQTLTLSSSPAALAWDGEALWAAYRDSRLIERIDPQTGRVLATVTGGDGTTALVWTGGRLCVTDRRANSLQCMLPPTDGTDWTAEAPINVGQDPRAMVADGSGLLWVANRADDAIVQVNPATGAVSEPIPVGDGPVALAWDGRSVWVANRTESSVVAVNPATRAVSMPIAIDKFPSSLLWDGASLWVTNDGRDSILQIDTAVLEILLEVETGRDPQAVVWDGRHLWVASERDNAVVRISAGQDAVRQSVPLEGSPIALTAATHGLSVASSNAVRHFDPLHPEREAVSTVTSAPVDIVTLENHILIAREDGNIQLLNPSDGSVAVPFAAEHRPTALAWDGSSVWIASAAAGVIYPVDPFNGERMGRDISVGAGPAGLLWDGERLWVANTVDGSVMRINTGIGLIWSPITVGDTPRAMAWDGESLWVANAGSSTLTQIAPGGTVLATIPVNEQPVALAWDGISLWVANQGSNTVQQIDPLTAQVQATIPVDDRPVDLAWDGERLWVATGGSTLQEINTRSLNLIMLARRLASPLMG